MSDGMKMTAGNKMRSILEKLTSNRFLAVGVGAFVTMVIQSSSATTVMLVSFVNSGLLSFVQGLGVISWFKYRQYRHCTDCRVQGNRLCSGSDRNRGTDVSFFQEGIHQKHWLCYTRVWTLVSMG